MEVRHHPDQEPILTQPISDTGGFGPVSINASRQRTVYVSASIPDYASELIPAIVVPGQTAVASVKVQRGNVLWVQVLDGKGVPLSGAKVQAKVKDELWSRRVTGESGTEGYVRLSGLNDGSVEFSADKRGYERGFGQVLLPEKEVFTHQVFLREGGRLAGLVLGDRDLSAPCVIHVLPYGDRALAYPIDTGEAGFEFESVPLGTVRVFAECDGRVSETVVAELRPNVPEFVELRLGESETLSGVVSSSKGEFVPNAEVTLLREGVAVGSTTMASRLGDFELEVYDGIGSVALEISADGYRTEVVSVDRDEVRLGRRVVVRLMPVARVEVELVGIEPGKGAVYTLRREGDRASERAFSDDGLAEMVVAEEGVVGLILESQSGTNRKLSVVTRGGRLSRLQVKVGGSSSISVLLQDFAPKQLDDGVFVVAREVTPTSERAVSEEVYRWLVGVDACEFEGLGPGLYWVQAMTLSGDILAAVAVDCIDGNNQAMLQMTGAILEVTVQNDRGEGLQGVSATLQYGYVGAWAEGVSDSAGLVRFPVPGPIEAKLFLDQRSSCSVWGLPVSLSGASGVQAINVVLSCNAGLALRLIDSNGAIHGALVRLAGLEVPDVLRVGYQTDSDGRVTFNGLSEGRYRVSIASPGYWPYVQDRIASVDPEVQEIWIPRLADLVVQVRKENGRPVVGREVRVWSEIYDKDTRRWQEAGVMDVAPADWKTDSEGRVTIPKFAEGRYTCSVLDEDGERVAVEVHVLPDQDNVALIELPE